jgi:predicted dehydrogenase
MDLGAHSLDLIFQLFESSELKDVMSVSRTKFGDDKEYTYRNMHGEEGKPHRFDVEDSATVLLETTGGQTANLEIAWAANCESRHEYYIYGTEAGAYLDLTDASFSSSKKEENRLNTDLELFEVKKIETPHFYDVNLDANTSNPYKKQFKQFIDAIKGDSAAAAVDESVDQALAVQKAIHKIYD